MTDSLTVAQARLAYEQFQADHLAATPLSAMADWVAEGTAPAAETLRAQGFTTAGPPNPEGLKLARKAFIRSWGYAIPCAEALEALGRLGPLVEVGCGTAYWTALLRNAGSDAVATDLATGRSDYGFDVGRYAAVERLSAAEAIAAYPERHVFCSWPTAEASWAADAVPLVQPGRAVAMILDERSTLTGDAALPDVLARHCELVETVVLPQFPGTCDRLLIHRRR